MFLRLDRASGLTINATFASCKFTFSNFCFKLPKGLRLVSLGFGTPPSGVIVDILALVVAPQINTRTERAKIQAIRADMYKRYV